MEHRFRGRPRKCIRYLFFLETALHDAFGCMAFFHGFHKKQKEDCFFFLVKIQKVQSHFHFLTNSSSVVVHFFDQFFFLFFSLFFFGDVYFDQYAHNDNGDVADVAVP
ncbi:hypothetical protein Pfo_013671 [Paulownia fortunei]|nr:hypothetical protein Pfo_013671 [Paulownia fortunei]